MSGCAADKIYDDFIKTPPLPPLAAAAPTAAVYLLFFFRSFLWLSYFLPPAYYTISKYIYEHNPNICLVNFFSLLLLRHSPPFHWKHRQTKRERGREKRATQIECRQNKRTSFGSLVEIRSNFIRLAHIYLPCSTQIVQRWLQDLVYMYTVCTHSHSQLQSISCGSCDFLFLPSLYCFLWITVSLCNYFLLVVFRLFVANAHLPDSITNWCCVSWIESLSLLLLLLLLLQHLSTVLF